MRNITLEFLSEIVRDTGLKYFIIIIINNRYAIDNEFMKEQGLLDVPLKFSGI